MNILFKTDQPIISFSSNCAKKGVFKGKDVQKIVNSVPLFLQKKPLQLGIREYRYYSNSSNPSPQDSPSKKKISINNLKIDNSDNIKITQKFLGIGGGGIFFVFAVAGVMLGAGYLYCENSADGEFCDNFRRYLGKQKH